MRVAALLGPDVSEKDAAPLRAAAVQVEVFGPELASLAGFDAAAVFGGDGTVHRHLPALVESQASLLVVPRGSGNDFARATGMRDVASALRAWERYLARRDNVRAVDVGVIAGGDGARTLFCCIGGAGLDAEANRRANAMPRTIKGLGGYVLAALSAAAGYQPRRVTVRTPSGTEWATRVDAPAMLVAFANAAEYGGGFRIAPDASLDDGLLDVCFIRQTSFTRLLRLMPTVFSGKHTRHPEVEYFQAPALRVETERPMDVYADGEYVCATPVEVGVQPRALRVIVGA